MRYNHKAIEKKWQRIWKEKKLFKAEVDRSRPKYYVLDMFPYPSGAGLHVGHVTGYTATDIIARYKRQKGYNVLHPMGWDSFGLQAEQYAIRTGTHPKTTTERNINTYRRQLCSLGLSYDWDREFATSDPNYYKWTQWIFTLLHKKGLAYRAEMLVNYCPALGTVLANEEVSEGCSIEGGFPVERRPLKQWVLKITSYAERLLEDLEELDWPDYLKRLQRNWIGKSEGAKVTFLEEQSDHPIMVFTTRPDTLFATTFLVLSPEHPLALEVTTEKQREAVKCYLKEAEKKSDLQRMELCTEKSGVWSGAFALHPITGERLPIWIADYVVMGYGTGAVMGVPGGDERDFEFARRYDLPIVAPYDPEGEEGVDEALRSEVLKTERCWTGGGKALHREADLLNINGLSIEEAKERVIDFLEKQGKGERATSYKLRDWLFSRQRYWGEPFPLLLLEDGSLRLLEMDELPLMLPELTSYEPLGEGRAPLERAKEWMELTDPKTGQRARRESHTMPQWAGSCWYYLRFCDPSNQTEAWNKEVESYWMPVDLYVGGVEHAVLHLLYARFWHKILYDCGHVSTKEPFHSLRNQGLVTAKSYKQAGGGYLPPEEGRGKEGVVEAVEKMSKSKLNGVTPDEIIEEEGADALRLYEMFMAPFDKEKLWDSKAISGCRRFLDRFYALVFSNQLEEEASSREGLALAYKLVYGVEQDIEAFHFNTAIAKMMEFINDFSKLPRYPKRALEMATQVLAPFAPHLAEECWEHLGHCESLTYAPFPTVDPSYLTEESATYVVQVNGKFRERWTLPKGESKEALLKRAYESQRLLNYLQGEVVKTIFVPDKLLNIVVKP